MEGSVLLDGASGTLPLRPMFGVVRNGPEAAGEITGRVLDGSVTAGAGIDAERVVELSFSAAEPGVLGRPAAFGGELDGSLFDAVLDVGDVAAGGHALLLQLFDFVVEVLAFVFVTEGG